MIPTTFVLILTILTNAGPSITAVPGFRSDYNCQEAGRAWAANMPAFTLMQPGHIQFVCKPQ